MDFDNGTPSPVEATPRELKRKYDKHPNGEIGDNKTNVNWFSSVTKYTHSEQCTAATPVDQLLLAI